MNEEAAFKTLVGKMMKAEWISNFGYTNDSFALDWTQKGSAAAAELSELFRQLGGDMYVNELAALIVILREFSPAGGDDAARHRA